MKWETCGMIGETGCIRVAIEIVEEETRCIRGAI
jgi:hypothetical protein